MTNHPCCIVLDCRRTGKPTKPDRPFICAKHTASAGKDLLKKYAEVDGANTRTKGQNSHWRFMEQSTWERICEAVGNQHALKPKASAPTTSGT